MTEDPQLKEWEESLLSLGLQDAPEVGSLAWGQQKCLEGDAKFRAWLIKAFEEAEKGDDTSWLEGMIEQLQVASDENESRIGFQNAPFALNRWGARYSMEEALTEYGLTSDVSPLEQESESWDLGYFFLEEKYQEGPQLLKVDERQFESRSAARKEVLRIREFFHKKGDHQEEVIRMEIAEGQAKPYRVTVLWTDGNWDHKRSVAEWREEVVEKASEFIKSCDTRTELNRASKRIKELSTHFQRHRDGVTKFRGSHIKGWGLDYQRFAKLMNLIADRAESLELNGFRTYKIWEYKSTRKPVDGDMLDVGARAGEFQGLNVADAVDQDIWETDEFLWTAKEGTWKPSPACLARLIARGPVSQQSVNWTSLVQETDQWLIEASSIAV